MNKLFPGFLLASILFLAGCATTPPQKNIALTSDFYAAKPKVGIYVSPTPKITTQFPGAGCLLCMLAASAAHTSLTTHVETFHADQLKTVKETIIALLKAKGIDAVVIDTLIKDSKMSKLATPTNPYIRFDYSVYKKQYDVDQLLVLNYYSVGVRRNYSSYIPVGEPQAEISAQFYIIDTKLNEYSFFNPLNVTRSSESAWDKPPSFPGITNAFYQTEEAAIDQIKDALK